MRMKFEVIISSSKNEGDKLDIEIHRPKRVAKKWGSLALLTHMGIMKGLQDAYKIADGQMVNEENGIGIKQSEGVSDNTSSGIIG